MVRKVGYTGTKSPTFFRPISAPSPQHSSQNPSNISSMPPTTFQHHPSFHPKNSSNKTTHLRLNTSKKEA